MTMQDIRQLEKALNTSTRRVDELCMENEKLRGLVRDMYGELDAATQYDAGGGRGVVHEFANRMHELGWKWPDECSES